MAGKKTKEITQGIAKRSSPSLSPQLKVQYLKELQELTSSFSPLSFLKKKVEDLELTFSLRELASCYRLALNTFKDFLEKQERDIIESKREQEKFKLRTKLLMEELMLPAGETKQKNTDIYAVENQQGAVENKELLEEYERSYQRLKTDFDNFKRRTSQQMEQFTQTANEKLILKLLPIVDNFNLAAASIPQDEKGDAYRQGVLLIKRQVEELLEKEGLVVIETIGMAFNPKYHEAFAHEETNEAPEDTILEEVRKGYCLREKVIRPSLVRVAKNVMNKAESTDGGCE